MLKKFLQISLIVIFIVAAYLFAANWYIYYYIEEVGLKSTNTQQRYVFNNELDDTSSLIYVALGDSLTSGLGANNINESYSYLIAEKFAQEPQKIIYANYSYPGARTKDLIQNLLAPAISEKPDVVTLLIGVNDIHGKVSKKEFKRNYEIILTELKSKTTAKINVVSLPLIGADSLLLPPLRQYYQDQTTKFNLIIKDLATQYNLNYIDLTTPTDKYAHKMSEYYAADAFHPSSIGYKYWSQIIYDNLNQ